MLTLRPSGGGKRRFTATAIVFWQSVIAAMASFLESRFPVRSSYIAVLRSLRCGPISRARAWTG